MADDAYRILRVSQMPDWAAIQRAEIACYPWTDGENPKAYGQVVFLDKVGFLVRMICCEAHPKATFLNENDPVCKDSCLEFFANFHPTGSESGYLNCEANAYGTLLCGIGPQRAGRKKLKDLGLARPEIKTVSGEGFWGYELLIPCSLLQLIYGPQKWTAGTEIQGNFYKCGDETDHPHYGMWHKIDWPTPDFHRPEQFGRLILE